MDRLFIELLNNEKCNWAKLFSNFLEAMIISNGKFLRMEMYGKYKFQFEAVDNKRNEKKQTHTPSPKKDTKNERKKTTSMTLTDIPSWIRFLVIKYAKTCRRFRISSKILTETLPRANLRLTFYETNLDHTNREEEKQNLKLNNEVTNEKTREIKWKLFSMEFIKIERWTNQKKSTQKL